MRGFMIGVVGFLGVAALGFGALVMMADGMEPTQEEVRVELEDNFPR